MFLVFSLNPYQGNDNTDQLHTLGTNNTTNLKLYNDRHYIGIIVLMIKRNFYKLRINDFINSIRLKITRIWLK